MKWKSKNEKSKWDALVDFMKDNIELEWDDIIKYLENEHLDSSDKDDILKAIDYDEEEIDFDSITEYIERKGLSSNEERELLEYLNDDKGFNVKTLEEEMKLEVVRNLYNNMTLQELEKIEKSITIKIL